MARYSLLTVLGMIGAILPIERFSGRRENLPMNRGQKDGLGSPWRSALSMLEPTYLTGGKYSTARVNE